MRMNLWLASLLWTILSSNPQGAAAAEEPSYAGKSLSQWIKLLISGEESEKGASSSIFAFREMGEPAVKPLMGVLSHPNGKARQRAVVALALLGERASRAAPLLIKMLIDDEVGLVRASAAYALTLIHSRDKRVVPALLHALKDKDPFCRFWAIWALNHRPPIPQGLEQEVVKRARAALKDSKANVRYEAALFLGQGAQHLVEVIPVLSEALRKSTHPPFLCEVLRVLRDIGPPAKMALTTIRPLLNHKKELVREAAKDAIAEIMRPKEKQKN